MTACEIRCAIEVRADETRQSPGRLVGTLLTYGERASDRAELFAAGSLRWPDGGIMLREQHNRQAPIARFTPALQGDRLIIDAPMPDTTRGRDAIAGVRAGVYGGLSVEFYAEDEQWAGELRTINRGVLVGAGLVDDPSYGGSTVEVRHRLDRAEIARLLTWL